MLDIASLTKKISKMEEEKEIQIHQFYITKNTSNIPSIFENIKQIDLMIHKSYFELATLKMKILKSS